MNNCTGPSDTTCCDHNVPANPVVHPLLLKNEMVKENETLTSLEIYQETGVINNEIFKNIFIKWIESKLY